MTRSDTETWTLTNAKYLASKVTTDMLRCQQNYREPDNDAINSYGTELALLLRDGYVATYEFGFKFNELRLVSWSYTVDAAGSISADDRPGKVVSGVDISNASFFNYLTYSPAWGKLAGAERDRIKAELPVQRVTCDPPNDGHGYWERDLSYTSSGVTLVRKTFRPL